MPAAPTRRPATPAAPPRHHVTRGVAGAGVLGVAGLAVVMVGAPTAEAAPAVAAPAVTAPAVAAAQAAPAVAPAVAPRYGRQKYRVGVQVADGSYVPAGTTTADTEITVVATKQNGAQRTSFTCRTEDNGDDPTASPTATYCTAGADKAVVPAVTVEPGAESQLPFFQLFQAQAGDTITVTQTSVNADLVRDTETATIPPCETDTGDTCFSGQDESQLATTVTFDDPGLPPLATDDTATTPLDTPVQIPVFANDDTVVGAPVTATAITAPPSHGTVVLDPGTPPAEDRAAAAVTPPVTAATVTYTPAAGFTGADTFRYSYSTANGTATALVTVTVTGSAVTPSPSPTSPSTPTPTAPRTTGPRQLATTGGDTDGLLTTGAALLLVGGAVTAVGRRRRTARHG